tara:strand:- start:785 stop:1006 length:222 start_codon:yes stop_codon:yes gene_type:complete
MRNILRSNLREIKKFYTKRKPIVSKEVSSYLKNEFKEWVDDSFEVKENIWSLPDLTQSARFENFCRSIRKKIN